MEKQKDKNNEETEETLDEWNELSALINSLYKLCVYTAGHTASMLGKTSSKKMFKILTLILQQKNMLDENIFQFSLEHPDKMSREEALQLFYDSKQFEICIKDKKRNQVYIL